MVSYQTNTNSYQNKRTTRPKWPTARPILKRLSWFTSKPAKLVSYILFHNYYYQLLTGWSILKKNNFKLKWLNKSKTNKMKAKFSRLASQPVTLTESKLYVSLNLLSQCPYQNNTKDQSDRIWSVESGRLRKLATMRFE